MKIRSRWLTKLVGWIASLAFRLLARTLRWTAHAEVAGIDPAYPTEEFFLYAIWHDAIALPLARKSLSATRGAALVSQHQDGSYLDEFMRHLGVDSIRGSSSRGGDKALRTMMRQVGQSHIFITPDGPRGPRRQMKEGIIWLASASGRPIVPSGAYSPTTWRIPGSWTDLTVPKPFARSHYLLGRPIVIPPNLSRAQLAEYRRIVQDEMDRIYRELEAPGTGPVEEPRSRAA